MAQIRRQRLAELIKQELGKLLQFSVKDPRIGFVTVTSVEMSGDLHIAKVYVSVLGSEEEKSGALAGLAQAKGFLRTEIGKCISVRYTPELEFVLDQSVAYSERIDNLLADLGPIPPSSSPESKDPEES